MQGGAAVVERAKSRGAYIKASQKSDVYPTIRVAAYCSRVGSNPIWSLWERGEFRYGMFGRVSGLCISGTYLYFGLYLQKKLGLVTFPSYIQTLMFYQAPPHVNLCSALTRKLAIRSHEK